jgi:hypothetical protein
MLGPCAPGDRNPLTSGVQSRLGAVFRAPTQGEQARDEQEENEGDRKNQIMHGSVSLHRAASKAASQQDHRLISHSRILHF